MTKFLLTAVVALSFGLPAMAAEMATPAAKPEAAPVVAPVGAPTTTVDDSAIKAPIDAAALEACKKEAADKIKLPENASAAEIAQFDAVVSECVVQSIKTQNATKEEMKKEEPKKESPKAGMKPIMDDKK